MRIYMKNFATSGVVTALAALLILTGAARAQTTFVNTAPIAIPSSGTASPYGSSITVSGLSGSVVKATVTLNNFSHTYPSDVGVLLVAPSGATVNLISECGGGADAVNANLTFDDAAAGNVPDAIVSGTYRPTQCATETYSAPAPAQPYGTALSVLNGSNPNGAWRLFVQDFSSSDSGSIAGGWSLTINSNTNPDAVQFGFAAYSGTEGADAIVAVTRANASGAAISIDYQTASGTATGGAACAAGVDFINANGTLNFAGGETSKSFAVRLCGDSIADAGETVNLTLSNPQNGAALGTPNAATLTVFEPSASFQFATANVAAPEFRSSVALTVTRAGDASGAASVNFATQNGGAIGGAACGGAIDFIAQSGTLSFASGVTNQNITIRLCDDAAQEGDENFTIALSNASAGAIVASPNQATVTIQDDELNPTTLTVNTTNDQNDGACNAAHCSLREAIAAAALGGATVNFSPAFNQPQTIFLTNGELAINKRLTINGGSASGRVTVSGSNQSRVFYVTDGAGLTVNALTIAGGNGTGTTVPARDNNGGAIYNANGIVRLNGSTVGGSAVLNANQSNGKGGGIYSDDDDIGNGVAAVTLTDSTVSGNRALTTGGGIANFSGSALAVVNSNVSDNTANQNCGGFGCSGVNGGGIANVGTLSISGSTISNNTANGFGGGGIDSFSGTATVSNSAVSGNSALGASGGGGGIKSGGATTITNSIIGGNQSQDGGGIFCNRCTLNVAGSRVAGNTARQSNRFNSEGGGGISLYSLASLTMTDSTVSGNQSQNRGGAITMNGATASIYNSTINSNSVVGTSSELGTAQGGGGILKFGNLTLVNSTVSGNASQTYGGGIYNGLGTLTATNSTVAGNAAQQQGGGVYSYADTANNLPTTARFRNTIIAANTANAGQPDIFHTSSDTFTSDGNNLIGNAGDTNAAVNWNAAPATADILNQSPRLSPLGNYGGATYTHALLSNSPAINAGNDCVLTANDCGANDPSTTLTSDQRGANRVGRVDIGAFESNNAANGGSFVARLPNGRAG